MPSRWQAERGNHVCAPGAVCTQQACLHLCPHAERWAELSDSNTGSNDPLPVGAEASAGWWAPCIFKQLRVR